MHRFRSGFYWDRIFIYIIAPIICIAIIISAFIYVPPQAKAYYQKIKAQEQMEKEAEIKREKAIIDAEKKKSVREMNEKLREESKRAELENVQKSTLDYETKLANNKYCRGTCVEDEEYGFGRVEKVYGFEITTKEGWNFNYLDVENKVRKLTVISPRRYKKMLKAGK